MLYMRANPSALICRIDVTAFVSVMILLVFTMLLAVAAQSPQTFHRSRIDLPRVAHPVGMWRADRPDAVVVTVFASGTIFLGKDLVAAPCLGAKITEQLSLGAERKIYIKAEALAKYEKVEIVLAAVRSSGVENVAFLVEQGKPR
jgi:biopolymer transport protein TolR